MYRGNCQGNKHSTKTTDKHTIAILVPNFLVREGTTIHHMPVLDLLLVEPSPPTQTKTEQKQISVTGLLILLNNTSQKGNDKKNGKTDLNVHYY